MVWISREEVDSREYELMPSLQNDSANSVLEISPIICTYTFRTLLAKSLRFVTQESFSDARRILLSHMYPDERKIFVDAYESNFEEFECRGITSVETEDILPAFEAYLTDDFRTLDWEAETDSSDNDSDCSADEESSEDDATGDQEEPIEVDKLPEWFKIIARSEVNKPFFDRIFDEQDVQPTHCFFSFLRLSVDTMAKNSSVW